MWLAVRQVILKSVLKQAIDMRGQTTEMRRAWSLPPARQSGEAGQAQQRGDPGRGDHHDREGRAPRGEQPRE